jgi:hypothetical protein
MKILYHCVRLQKHQCRVSHSETVAAVVVVALVVAVECISWLSKCGPPGVEVLDGA